MSGEVLRRASGGCRGEEESVAIVSGCNEVVGLFGESAEEGKAVGCCGAKARPGFKLWGVGEGRK